MVGLGLPLPEGIEIPEEDWQKTPASIRALVILLLKRIAELEAKLAARSDTSHRPPSTDGPFTKRKRQKKRKAGGKKGHQGFRQAMLAPTDTVDLEPERCSCGNTEFPETEPYHTHQRIELPEIPMEVIHSVLHQVAVPGMGSSSKRTSPGSRKAAMARDSLPSLARWRVFREIVARP